MPAALALEPSQTPSTLRLAAQGPLHSPHEEALPPPLPHSCQLHSHPGDRNCPWIDLSERWSGHWWDSEPAGVPLLHAAVPQHDEFELAAHLAS